MTEIINDIGAMDTGDNKKDIRTCSLKELKVIIESMGEKAFRAAQIFSWLHEKKVESFDEMTNISNALKDKLSGEYDIYKVEPVEVLKSKIDGTRKYIHRLHDGNVIESVLLQYEYGNSVCISSQVGCRMGCKFCASTVDGLERNLTAGEMAGQIYAIEKECGQRVGHVVIMGSGEPMDNYDNFLRFVELITHEKGANISGRNITVSTCGIVPKIYELAERKLSITLALSLHATTNEKRKEIMPIANKYSLDEIISACKNYFDKTGRRITLEYSLIAGKNDTDEDAKRLISIASELNSHVNLIPVNPIKERDYKATNHQAVVEFKNKLEKRHINATVRRTMGQDIDASCGQLRKRYMEKTK